jgi:hypothetical protein
MKELSKCIARFKIQVLQMLFFVDINKLQSSKQHRKPESKIRVRDIAHVQIKVGRFMAMIFIIICQQPQEVNQVIQLIESRALL